MKYGIHLEFDIEGDPPGVFIAGNEGRGGDLIEVLEEPKCKKAPDGTRDKWGNPIEPWSWDDDDWEVGPLAKMLLEFLNTQTAF